MEIRRKNIISAAILSILTAFTIICGSEPEETPKNCKVWAQTADNTEQYSAALFKNLNDRKTESTEMYRRLETLLQYNALFADYPDIDENTKKQLIIFAENSDMWRDIIAECGHTGGYVSYTVYDLDKDGKLELTAEAGEQGRLFYTWHNYYHADITNETVITLEPAYSEGEASSHTMNKPELYAYEDAESGNIYYAVTLQRWSPDNHSTTYLDGFFYLENNVLKRKDIRYRVHYADTDINEYYTPYPSKTALNKTTYEQLYTNFVQGMTLKQIQMSWFELKGNENLTSTEILKILLKSYVEGVTPET